MGGGRREWFWGLGWPVGGCEELWCVFFGWVLARRLSARIGEMSVRSGGLRPKLGYVSAPDGTEFRRGPKVLLMMRQTPKSLSPVASVGSDWARPKGRRRRLFGEKRDQSVGLDKDNWCQRPTIMRCSVSESHVWHSVLSHCKPDIRKHPNAHSIKMN